MPFSTDPPHRSSLQSAMAELHTDNDRIARKRIRDRAGGSIRHDCLLPNCYINRVNTRAENVFCSYCTRLVPAERCVLVPVNPQFNHQNHQISHGHRVACTICRHSAMRQWHVALLRL